MATPGRNDDDDHPDGPAPADAAPPGADPSGNGGAADYDDYDGDADDANDDRAPWYSWERWKYIGGTLFLLLSITGVGYVIWDILDLLPRPVTIELIRAALRESPGRITDMLALAGMISFGPPAGVDLMFGATQAAKSWSRRMQKKDRAEGIEIGVEKGRVEGRAEGRVEGRNEVIAELRARANGNTEWHKLLDEVADSGE